MISIKSGLLSLRQIVTPGTPATGFGYVYTKADNNVYNKGPDAVEHRLVPANDTLFATTTARLSLRDKYLKPNVITYDSMPRSTQINTAQTIVSGVLQMVAVALPAGAVISNISFMSGATGAISPTNWWFGLYDSARLQLALTANQTTTAWGVATTKTVNIASTAAGAGTTFTTTYEGLHYLGMMMTAGTPVNLAGAPGLAVVTGLAPILYGTSDTAQTTPPAYPRTVAALTSVAGFVYAGCA